MTKNVWISIVIAIAALAGSAAAYMSGINYLPSILMFVSALVVLGLSMTAEDTLLKKYDTPHDEDKHPAPLILLRAVRAIVVIAMGILIFYLAF